MKSGRSTHTGKRKYTIPVRPYPIRHFEMSLLWQEPIWKYLQGSQQGQKTRYYYYCKNTVTPTGHSCSFRVNLEQTEINDMVAVIVSAMVNNPRFSEAIQAKISSAVDTADMEKQLETLQAQLRQTLGTKSRLEWQIDSLDVADPYYDRKILDLQRRYDEQYGKIEEIEIQIDNLQSKIRSIKQEKISGDNIYRLLLVFDQVYASASEVERKEFMGAFIERIDLFPEKQKDGCWIEKHHLQLSCPNQRQGRE